MKFISLPNDGASWRDSLIYHVDLETEVEGVAKVEIINTDDVAVIASFNIYGVTDVEFDIAPYLRDSMPREFSMEGVSGFVISPWSCRVMVRVNGQLSDSRVYYRATLNTSQVGLLSNVPESQRIAHGESIYLTIYAHERANVRVQQMADKVSVATFSIITYGQPVEFVFPMLNVNSKLRELLFDFIVDGSRVATYRYKYIQRDSTAMELVWYNKNGGVESYIFPRVDMLSCEALMGSSGDKRRVVGEEYRYALHSAYEAPEQLRRLATMVFADNIYVSDGGVLREVELLTRKLEGDDKSLNVVIKSNWRVL